MRVNPPPFLMTPRHYAGEESVTYPNGLIEKSGLATGALGTITFDEAFPNGIKSVADSQRNSTAGQTTDQEVRVYDLGVTSFKYRIITPSADPAIYWIAKGW